jgi:anaerobic ribonucleoside-triphosphate reductase
LVAVSTYLMGISILEKMTASEEIDSATLKKQIAKAYCSIGEIYLTDLCYDVEAEIKCETAINKALATDADR